eukprot:2122533-Rhodomonas_salina.1
MSIVGEGAAVYGGSAAISADKPLKRLLFAQSGLLFIDANCLTRGGWGGGSRDRAARHKTETAELDAAVRVSQVDI